MAAKHLIIVCGEPSGDLNAACLAQAIKEINPSIKISGVGGHLLRQAGAEIFYDIKDLSVIGLFDALKKLPLFFSLRKLILQKIQEERPAAIILVDFSGFNLRLAKAIAKRLPVIYYVSPQVWASRQGRVKTIKKYIHKMIVLFKFEEEFYKKHGIDAEFTGHPLLDIARPSTEKKEFLTSLNLSDAKTTIALLPGSRQSEINNLLPIMLETARIIADKIQNVQFMIAKSPQVSPEIYDKWLGRVNLDGSTPLTINPERSRRIDLRIIEGKTYDCLNAADFCLVCSGTATLETAIIGKPFAIIYKMNLFNYLLYRPQVKIPYIGMVNIVAGKMIVPEFIQFKATPPQIASVALEIFRDPAAREQMKQGLAQVRSALGFSGASLRAAKIVVDFINK
jgi:lipid-A-disaccharide synthase